MKKSLSAESPRSRRQEYAELTRRAIVDAARKLFREHGYFSTKVDDIAALARVAPATVYAVSAGKQGLLRTLVDSWSTAPVIESTARSIDELDDPEAIIRLIAATCCGMRKEYGDIVHLILNTAPHDAEVAAALATGTDRYRKALRRNGRRLVELGALREGIDLNQAVDVLWFYFGYSGLFTLVDDNGWSYERAEKWLGDEAVRALLHKK
jgi:AcrR family transcriptional regulator